MPLSRLLWILLPGLIPLLVYVGASEIWGDFVGLVVGTGMGVAEFLFLLVTQKRLDGFVLADTALLVAMGGISLGLSDAIFFRLKPVFVEFLLVAFLAFSAFGPKNLLLGLVFKGKEGAAFQKALESSPEALSRMRGQLSLMTVVFAAHSALSLLSALWMSKEAWAFITGVLPFILVGVLTVVQLTARTRGRR